MQRKQPTINNRQTKQNEISSTTHSEAKRKIKYFACTKGKDHLGEVLNYVCFNKDCKKRGLLCSICRIEHNNHGTMPLKMLLTILQKQKEKPIKSSEEFQQYLSQFELLHNIMLYNLRRCVENLAQKFQLIQKNINDEFGKVKIQLFQKVQINMKFNSFVKKALNNQFKNREQFIGGMTKICEMINNKEDDKQSVQKSGNIKFSINLGLLTKKYKQMKTLFSDNFIKIEKFVDELIFPEKNEIKRSHERKEKDEKIQIQPSFLHTYKSSSIVLQEGDKVARQTKSNHGLFAFTNIHICSLNQKVLFKIKSLKSWIAVGVGIRQKIKFLNYRFDYTKLGHGSYLISSNGFTWSHTEQQDNKVDINFKFVEGDLIQLEYQKTKLIYTNKNNSKICQLKLGFNEVEEKDIYFCANLSAPGDSLEILQITN